MDVSKLFKYTLKPYQIVVISYLAIILIGSILLYLPISSIKPTTYLTALWTAVSATCVTGLVIVDTASHYSTLGQFFILLLIQLGGLGYMTAMTIVALLLGRKITIFDRSVLSETLNLYSIQGAVKLVKTLAFFVFGVEFLGALLLTIIFIPEFGFFDGLWKSIFHSISAFNNAGFDIMGNFASLTYYVNNTFVNFVITTLIIIGGFGFMSISEILSFRKLRHLSVHTKIVLRSTVILILIGTVLIFILEYNNPVTIGNFNLGEKLLASYFQAVTPRTAGFNTLPTSELLPATSIFIIILMFIGASPGGTGGGVKTSTLVILITYILSIIRGDDKLILFNKSISTFIIRKVIAIIIIASTLIICSTFLLSLTLKAPYLDILFETTSAFGTVGLSRGLTTNLDGFSKIILMFTMFAGRVGPLVLLVSLVMKKKMSVISFPEEKVSVG